MVSAPAMTHTLIWSGAVPAQSSRSAVISRRRSTRSVVPPLVAYVGVATDDNRGFFAMIRARPRLGQRDIELAKVASPRASASDARGLLEGCDLVFMSGGDVEHGMKVLSDRDMAGFLVGLGRAGKPMFGLSAGSLMLAAGTGFVFPDDDEGRRRSSSVPRPRPAARATALRGGRLERAAGPRAAASRAGGPQARRLRVHASRGLHVSGDGDATVAPTASVRRHPGSSCDAARSSRRRRLAATSVARESDSIDGATSSHRETSNMIRSKASSIDRDAPRSSRDADMSHHQASSCRRDASPCLIDDASIKHKAPSRDEDAASRDHEEALCVSG